GAFGRVGNDGHRNLRGMTGHRPVIAIKKHWGLGISSRHHRASPNFGILFLLSVIAEQESLHESDLQLCAC
ncbi:hypothetical protein ACW7BJ_35385, partial [Azospirillum argentinense]